MFSDQGADQVCSGIVQPDKNKDRHDKERRVAHDTGCPRFCADEIQYGEGAGTINLGKERKCPIINRVRCLIVEFSYHCQHDK